MRHPKYLTNMDNIQQALIDAEDGLTMKELMVLAQTNYSAVQQATTRLCNLGRIYAERRGRSLCFYICT